MREQRRLHSLVSVAEPGRSASFFSSPTIRRKSLRPVGQNFTRKFSRLITCGVCGATFIRRLKARDERHAAWACGTRIRIDMKLCGNHHAPREDYIVAIVDRTMRQVVQDTDAIVEEAVAEDRKLTGVNRGELRRVRNRIAAEC